VRYIGTSNLDNELIFCQLIKENSGCASYVIGSAKTRKCILVDPLMDTERYETFLEEKHLDPLALLDTHTHADHLSGLRYFARFPNAVLAIHEKAPVNFPSQKLRDGELLNERFPDLFFANYMIKVLYTPGHATDHICLLLLEDGRERKLLSGDSLFIGDVGRTDLGRGDNDLMYDSLFRKILKLDPEAEVYPAHVGAKHFLSSGGVKTQVKIERDTNPALQTKSREEFEKYMTEGWPPKPSYYEEIININLGKLSLLDVQEEIHKKSGSSLQQARK